MRDLRTLRSESFVVTLECAGNGRSLFDLVAPGEQWGLGAVSTAEWTGVPLIEVIERAGPLRGATELAFQGADCGLVEGRDAPICYERSLSFDQAREAGALLAYEMNGEPLSSPHGYPLRLIVPGWYAVASVKWLTEITVGHALRGPLSDGQVLVPVGPERARGAGAGDANERAAAHRFAS
jgi:DMSO/TMAO reductase YedYZ molybdopterin-dependent catalytic subunit